MQVRWTGWIVVCVWLLGCSPDAPQEQVASDTEPQGEDTQASPDTGATGEDVPGVDTAPPPDVVVNTDPTWWQDVRPIFDRHCTQCHTDEGIAPFELHSYATAVEQASLIRSEVRKSSMPPWPVDPECKTYQGDLSLSDEKRQTIIEWIDANTPEGDPEAPAELNPLIPPTLSRVDLELALPEPYTPQLAPDDYRCFVLDWPETELAYITGMGVLPDQVEIVHHLVSYIAGPELAQTALDRDARDETPGYTCFGDPKLGVDLTDLTRLMWLGSWAPGGGAQDFPEGTGIPVEPGSKIIVQMHYNTLTAEPVPDQTQLLLKVDKTVERPAMYLPYMNPRWTYTEDMLIPAGQAEVTHGFSFDPTWLLGKSFDMYSANMHMHMLGSAASASITSRGKQNCLIDIPKWDFDWQREYLFPEPIHFSSGDQLNISCTWDNSAANQIWVGDQQLPPRDVFWGDGTTDEMCLGVFYIALDP